MKLKLTPTEINLMLTVGCLTSNPYLYRSKAFEKLIQLGYYRLTGDKPISYHRTDKGRDAYDTLCHASSLGLIG